MPKIRAIVSRARFGHAQHTMPRIRKSTPDNSMDHETLRCFGPLAPDPGDDTSITSAFTAVTLLSAMGAPSVDVPCTGIGAPVGTYVPLSTVLHGVEKALQKAHAKKAAVPQLGGTAACGKTRR